MAKDSHKTGRFSAREKCAAACSPDSTDQGRTTPKRGEPFFQPPALSRQAMLAVAGGRVFRTWTQSLGHWLLSMEDVGAPSYMYEISGESTGGMTKAQIFFLPRDLNHLTGLKTPPPGTEPGSSA